MSDNIDSNACAVYYLDQPNMFNAIELFGELHFNESPNSTLPVYLRPSSSTSSSSSVVEKNPEPKVEGEKDKDDTGIEGKGSQLPEDTTETHENSENLLQPCTQGLESKVFDAEEPNNENQIDEHKDKKMVDIPKPISSLKQCNIGMAREHNKKYPPPLSSFGKNGKPQYSFKHIREDGRLVIKMIKNPPQDYLHACRENGRLRIYLVKAEDQEDSAPGGGEVADPAGNQEQDDLDDAEANPINKPGGEDSSNEISVSD
ncbi:hypothetical protein FRX31_022135 [Thalictrum thalictroides]|uniref:FAF domain-containing protein n=1 Tax=Thalictrum thalictroides TaxID=46969 RepID=A0A7J6VT56_THATH|nr:hypothetical protein FRX31_022135 [Thalictrum thalictroides]